MGADASGFVFGVCGVGVRVCVRACREGTDVWVGWLVALVGAGTRGAWTL